MAVSYRPLARRDLEAIYDHTAVEWSVDQADRYVRMISDRLDAADAGTVPLRSLPTFPGFLVLTVGQHLAFCQRTDGTLDVVRILHHAMDFVRHLD